MAEEKMKKKKKRNLKQEYSINDKNYYPYIHASKSTYMTRVEECSNLYQFGSLHDKIKKEYQLLSNKAGKELIELDRKLPSGVKMLNIVEQMNNYIKNPNALKIADLDNINQIAYDLNSVHFKNLFLQVQEDTVQQARLLDDYIKNIEKLLAEVSKINDNLIKYFQQAESGQQEIAKNLLKSTKIEQLNFLNISKSGVKAFNKIESLLHLLQENEKNIKKNLKSIYMEDSDDNYQIDYVNSKQKKEKIKVSRVIGIISGNLNNIKGALGETIIGLFAAEKQEELISLFEEALYIEGIKITSQGVGEKRIKVKNGRTTSKTDIKINIKTDNIKVDGKYINNDNYNLDITFNISVKNQKFGDLSGNKTKFLDSKLYLLFEAFGQDKRYEYIILNYLGLDGKNAKKNEKYDNTKFYNYYDLANRYLAAKNFDTALAGQGTDRIVLLAYMDKILTINQYYEHLAKVTNIKSLPAIYVGKTDTAVSLNTPIPNNITLPLVDETPERKIALAMDRSKKVKNELLKLSARVMG